MNRIKQERENKINGALLGEAIGDALGQPVKALRWTEIQDRFGENGITGYELDPNTNKAVISDTVQLSLFHTEKLLSNHCIGNIQKTKATEKSKNCIPPMKTGPDVTGADGLIKVIPSSLYYPVIGHQRRSLDAISAETAKAIDNSFTYWFPAALLSHILNAIVHAEMALEEAIEDALKTVSDLYRNTNPYSLLGVKNMIQTALQLSKNGNPDIENIHTVNYPASQSSILAIALYCCVRHRDNFSDAILAAVNHSWNSQSVGTITGCIMGACLGYHAVDKKWLKDLDLPIRIQPSKPKPMPKNEHSSVTRDWVNGLSYKQQTTLFCALRGCDGVAKDDNTKAVVRELRGIILKNADGGHAFMEEKNNRKAIWKLAANMDQYPMHYIMHLVHAMEIIGYFHPDDETSAYWRKAYYHFISKMHVNPETKEENRSRLQDRRTSNNSKRQVFHYINLTNGIEAIPSLPSGDYRFIRIQSTVCENHLWDKLILELSDDLLMNLAMGNTCIVYDYGARKPVPKAVYLGLELIRYILNRRWLDVEICPEIRRNGYTVINCSREFDHYYRNLSRNAKRKLDYFRPYLSTDEIRLSAVTESTEHDGDKEYYNGILKGQR